MKKRKLNAEIEYDFDLYGLISTLKEYKLAWHLNNALDIQLDKVDDVKITFLKSKSLIISNYLYATEHSSIRLLRNRSADEFESDSLYVMPELKRFDFLLLVQGFEDTYDQARMKQQVGSVPQVQYVQSFVVDDLKSRENLIF